MLAILGLIISVVAAFNIYRIAKKNKRNARLWAAVVFIIGVVIEVVAPLLLVMISFFALVSSGNSINETERILKNPVVIIDTICLILNIAGILAITYFVAQAPKEKSFTVPPQPPKFN